MSAPLASMTGFARASGSIAGLAWGWELRSVNSRGLDLHFRLPPGLDALEPRLRGLAAKLLRRGNINATLTVQREAATRLVVDAAALEQALSATLALADRIPGAPPPRAEALLTLPGVLRPASTEAASEDELRTLEAGFEAALEALLAARHAEGARIGAVLATQLAEITALVETARDEAAAQPALQRARLAATLQALLREAGTAALGEDRLAQEIALLATRADVREELDRLRSHLDAAAALLAEGAAVGRRFDFLLQEINRETNTLCSKSVSPALTATGLALKATIEQLREQVQNIE